MIAILQQINRYESLDNENVHRFAFRGRERQRERELGGFRQKQHEKSVT